MGYRLKLPSGQEITAPLAGTGAKPQQQTMDKVQGVWERCKESLVTESQSLNRLPQTFSKTLLPMNCGFMLRKRPTS